MTREILFRGKRLDNGKWAYGDLLHDWQDKGDCIRQGAEHSECGIFAVDPATIGQFTGLTDKNGRRIFEGDIVRRRNIELGTVEYCPYEALFHVGTDPLQAFVYGSRNPETMLVEIEVISNIHNTPELLNGV
jgi:uncharacterized phage protein (TIGR01671 family)